MKQVSIDERRRQWSAPAFRLVSAQGPAVSLGDYRGQSNIVLVFTHDGECEPCNEGLRGFDARRAEYQALDAEVWAVLPVTAGDAAALGATLAAALPRLLADPEGATRRAYETLLGEQPPATDTLIFVLDRFGAPYVAFASGRPDDPAVHDTVLDWLAGIELECPE